MERTNPLLKIPPLLGAWRRLPAVVGLSNADIHGSLIVLEMARNISTQQMEEEEEEEVEGEEVKEWTKEKLKKTK